MRLQESSDVDTHSHFSYFRMNAFRFDDLVRRVAPYIEHAPTHLIPISAAERLALTLRILASGDSQRSKAFNLIFHKHGYC